MKKLMVMSIALFFAFASNAQSSEENVSPKDSVTTTDKDKGDITKIRIGSRNIEIIEKDGKTDVNVQKNDEKVDDQKSEENNDKYGDYGVNKRIQDKVEKKIEDKFNDNNRSHEYKNNFEPHWGGFALGLNNFVDASGSMSLKGNNKLMSITPEKSYNVQLNLWEIGLPLSNNVGFVTGLGFLWNNFRFDKDNNVTITKVDGVVVPTKAPDGVTYEKSLLRATYLTAPLLFEVQHPLFGKKIYLSAGVIGGLKLGSRTKIETDKSDKKQITKDDFNINPFTCGATARIGYRFINIYAEYSLIPLFEKDKGPELYPLSIGLTLINF